jgi:hypothetical protein
MIDLADQWKDSGDIKGHDLSLELCQTAIEQKRTVLINCWHGNEYESAAHSSMPSNLPKLRGWPLCCTSPLWST